MWHCRKAKGSFGAGIAEPFNGVTRAEPENRI